jgi:hypothetical protein
VTRRQEEAGGLKISVQYRTREGKVFEFTDGTAILAVHIRRPEVSLPNGLWRTEARLGTAAGPSMAEGEGASAAEALEDLASIWRAQRPQLAFDWNVVTRELRLVHAV